MNDQNTIGINIDESLYLEYNETDKCNMKIKMLLVILLL